MGVVKIEIRALAATYPSLALGTWLGRFRNEIFAEFVFPFMLPGAFIPSLASVSSMPLGAMVEALGLSARVTDNDRMVT